MTSYLFNYFPKKDLNEMLEAFHACTNLFVQLLDEDGKIVMSAGQVSSFCKQFARNIPPEESCAQEHLIGAQRAVSIGEACFFCCHAGLYHIVFPIISREKMFGSVIAGPFLMDEADADLIIDIAGKYKLDTKSLLLLSDFSHQIQVVSPTKATYISRLLNYLTNSLIAGSRELQEFNHGKLLQQSRINESIQMYKHSGVKTGEPYPIDKENLLIAKVISGDIADARSIFNDLLGYLFLSENHDVNRIKVRIMELCTLLSRAAINRGSDIDMILAMNNKLIQSIMESKDIYGICYTFQDNMEIFTDSLFYASDKSNKTIKSATRYIAAHFAENITLSDLADHLHINASYLSTLFKQVTGHAFKEHLNITRVEEAKRLLADTDYPIMEIAVSCGFNDQSYFTKVFKHQTGLTPKQFR